MKGIKGTFGDVIMDKRTVIAILLIAILWRTGISLNGKIALWQSMCSGIALFFIKRAEKVKWINRRRNHGAER